MKIKVAAAAPELFPGRPGQNMTNVLAAISRARDDGAALLVLPAGLPEDMNRGALERQAGKMAVYPLTRPALPREELLHHHELDVLCCSDSSPATASSFYENEELAAAASHENMAVVVLACPRGGDGGRIYTGQCVIAQNGFTLASTEDGYAVASVNIPRRDAKAPSSASVTDQSSTPWTPLPEMLPRILRLQGDALAHRMMAAGATQLNLAVGRDASSLLALAACVEAVDRLKLSRRNIHADLTGNRAGRIGAALGVTSGPGTGMTVDTADLTARAVHGARPEHYAVNASIPRSVASLAVRWWANTCGNAALSAPVRSIVMDDAGPWVLQDFLLYFSLLYDMPKWALARLLDDTFRDRYKDRDIQQALDLFFDNYRRPEPCDGPAVFPLESRITL